MTFKEWCEVEGSNLRHEAAATGYPIIYLFLWSRESLALTMRDRFPSSDSTQVRDVEAAAMQPVDLDLEKVNEYRARHRLPKLSYTPDPREFLPFDPPAPGNPLPDTYSEFRSWALKKIEHARCDAAAEGIPVEQALMRRAGDYITDLTHSFPDIGPKLGLRFLPLILRDETAAKS